MDHNNLRFGQRLILPMRRRSETFDVKIERPKMMLAVTIGFDNQGMVREVFTAGAKTGSDSEAMLRDACILLSLGLQYGAPIEVIRGALTRDLDGEASSVVGKVIDVIAQVND